MKLVVIESPYAGDVEKHLRYLRACMADCFSRGEVPFASHAIYTQPGVLRDEAPEERAKGIGAGFAIARALHQVALDHPEEFSFLRAFYVDCGRSSGMRLGAQDAEERGQDTEVRVVPGWSGDGVRGEPAP